MSEKTPKIVSSHEAVEDSDPGVIILFASDGDIHASSTTTKFTPPNKRYEH